MRPAASGFGGVWRKLLPCASWRSSSRSLPSRVDDDDAEISHPSLVAGLRKPSPAVRVGIACHQTVVGDARLPEGVGLLGRPDLSSFQRQPVRGFTAAVEVAGIYGTASICLTARRSPSGSRSAAVPPRRRLGRGSSRRRAPRAARQSVFDAVSNGCTFLIPTNEESLGKNSAPGRRAISWIVCHTPAACHGELLGGFRRR